MVENMETMTVALPPLREAAPIGPVEAIEDQRPRFLRWLLPTACSSAVPLDGMQQAELKLIAYH